MEIGATIVATFITALISSLVGAVVGGIVSGIKNRTKKELDAEKAERLGVQCLLRTQLLNFHDKYTERGYCPTEIKRMIEEEYNAYHGLEGNGLVTRFYNDILALPDHLPKE